MDTAVMCSVLERLVDDASVPGAQFAMHTPSLRWGCELGVEEHGARRRFTAESKVPIGSISKTFTAALAMVLVSDGDLELDAPIDEYLPGPHRPAGDRLTLRHLLSHTSGLPSDREHPGASTLRRHALDALRELDPLARPGHAFSYSNIGYVITGHLIEVVTGMSWWEAMELVLLKPLGLRPTFVVGPEPRAHTATGHSVNRALRRVRPVQQSLAPVDAPAGAIAASATDLVVLGRLLAGAEPHDLIEPWVLEQMRTPAPNAEPFGVAHGWALGLALYHDGERTWVGHDGTADGTSCHLRIEPASGTVVALTTNGSTGFPMWHELVIRLRDQGLRIGDYDAVRTVQARVAAPEDQAACLGGYRNGAVGYEVGRDGAGLCLAVDGELHGELTLHDGLVFTVRNVETNEIDQTGRFLRDSQGRVEWIHVGGRLARRHDQTSDVA